VSAAPKIPPKGAENSRVLVWFDPPSDCICFGTRDGLEPGEALPPDKVIKIPLLHAEGFIETVMNAAMAEGFRADPMDFDKIMYGVQNLLDVRATNAFTLAERLRLERSKAAGEGVINSMGKEVIVHVDEYGKLKELLRQARACVFKTPLSAPAFALRGWMEENGFLEDA
jgi:hypothetical protein